MDEELQFPQVEGGPLLLIAGKQVAEDGGDVGSHTSW